MTDEVEAKWHQTFDIVTGETIQEAGQKLVEAFAEAMQQGDQIASVPHAYGPVDGKDVWTIMVLYQRFEPGTSGLTRADLLGG